MKYHGRSKTGHAWRLFASRLCIHGIIRGEGRGGRATPSSITNIERLRGLSLRIPLQLDIPPFCVKKTHRIIHLIIKFNLTREFFLIKFTNYSDRIDFQERIRCRRKKCRKGRVGLRCCDGDKLSPVLVATSSVENAVFSQNAGNNAKTKDLAGLFSPLPLSKGLSGLSLNLAESDTREHTYESMIRVFLLLSSKPSPRHRFLASFSVSILV